VAAVAENLPEGRGRRVIDASGLYVTPGLVDIHVHVFAAEMSPEYTGESNVRPDGFTFRSGVTTVVDAGCAGWRNFAVFKEQIIDRSRTRVLAWLNIVGHGMAGRSQRRTVFICESNPVPHHRKVCREGERTAGFTRAPGSGVNTGIVRAAA